MQDSDLLNLCEVGDLIFIPLNIIILHAIHCLWLWLRLWFCSICATYFNEQIKVRFRSIIHVRYRHVIYSVLNIWVKYLIYSLNTLNSIFGPLQIILYNFTKIMLCDFDKLLYIMHYVLLYIMHNILDTDNTYYTIARESPSTRYIPFHIWLHSSVSRKMCLSIIILIPFGYSEERTYKNTAIYSYLNDAFICTHR